MPYFCRNSPHFASSSPVKGADFRCFPLFFLLHYPHTPRLFPKGGRYGIRLVNAPHLKAQAPHWFHEKWYIPLNAYLTSMEAYLAKTAPVPQWYLAMAGVAIVGGLGVIENDFHNRKDLTPNICAVYTEKAQRGRGIAGALHRFAFLDMKEKGFARLYLLTDHIGFYERYGWRFYGMVQGEGKPHLSRMYLHEA